MPKSFYTSCLRDLLKRKGAVSYSEAIAVLAKMYPSDLAYRRIQEKYQKKREWSNPEKHPARRNYPVNKHDRTEIGRRDLARQMILNSLRKGAIRESRVDGVRMLHAREG